MENQDMSNDQYKGILNLIIKMIEEDVPKEKLIEYIEELKKNN